jgi:chromatin segregation and condensation protein Rec8/ScpA/Scc1 (kleisin family)
MANLVSKNENLKKSAPVIGAEILRLLKESDTKMLSIFDAARSLRKSDKIGARSLYYAILFLYSLGLIDFDEPYIISNVNN